MALTYMQVHCRTLLPVLAALFAIYRPVFGRRDALKAMWLCFMATVYTTPWDNWILYHSGWSYPAGSIWGRIYLVPLEEHLFFLVQSVLLVLLHSIITHPDLLPGSIRRIADIHRLSSQAEGNDDKADGSQPIPVQSLPKRPLAATFWLVSTLLGALLVHEAHDLGLADISLGLGKRAFYLGWILIWVSPVLGFLTWLGGRMGRAEMITVAIGTAWLWGVDTYAIRGGAWSISGDTTLHIDLWRGLPVEEALFFFIVSYLLTLSCSLISHLHTLMLLSPDLPVCPSRNPIKHIYMLYEIALNPPMVDARLVRGLIDAEETLRIGSKSFQVAKLAFGREMRIGLVAIYAWCRVTDDIIDNTPPGPAQLANLDALSSHLHASYIPQITPTERDRILNQLPDLPATSRSAFYIFTNLIPRLCPILPFTELLRGYATDLQFAPRRDRGTTTISRPDSGMAVQSASGSIAGGRRTMTQSVEVDPAVQLGLPIKTTQDLMTYADNVAGSIASAICYLSWSILDSDQGSEREVRRPVEMLEWAFWKNENGALVPEPDRDDPITPTVAARAQVVSSAREMGRALQLVNIARDVAKDALIGRLYIPLSHFSSARDILSILHYSPTPSAALTSTGDALLLQRPRPDYAQYNIPLLDLADAMRQRSFGAIDRLPRTARGGTRAMVASYFEIGQAVRREQGAVDERGVRVSKIKRVWAAAWAMWVG